MVNRRIVKADIGKVVDFETYRDNGIANGHIVSVKRGYVGFKFRLPSGTGCLLPTEYDGLLEQGQARERLTIL